MAYYAPDPGKKERIFYWDRRVDAWVAVTDMIAASFPPKFFDYDTHFQFLTVKRYDMTDEQFNALPVVEVGRTIKK